MVREKAAEPEKWGPTARPPQKGDDECSGDAQDMPSATSCQSAKSKDRPGEPGKRATRVRLRRARPSINGFARGGAPAGELGLPVAIISGPFPGCLFRRHT